MLRAIGLKDRDGCDIHEGDIVEFRVEYDAACAPHYDTPDATRMVDKVKIIDGVPYFIDEDLGIGSLACRHNAHCRVISRLISHETQ